MLTMSDLRSNIYYLVSRISLGKFFKKQIFAMKSSTSVILILLFAVVFLGFKWHETSRLLESHRSFVADMNKTLELGNRLAETVNRSSLVSQNRLANVYRSEANEKFRKRGNDADSLCRNLYEMLEFGRHTKQEIKTQTDVFYKNIIEWVDFDSVALKTISHALSGLESEYPGIEDTFLIQGMKLKIAFAQSCALNYGAQKTAFCGSFSFDYPSPFLIPETIHVPINEPFKSSIFVLPKMPDYVDIGVFIDDIKCKMNNHAGEFEITFDTPGKKELWVRARCRNPITQEVKVYGRIYKINVTI
jgi:hypothetical protein